jgi:hypothetical protein
MIAMTRLRPSSTEGMYHIRYLFALHMMTPL